MAFSYNRDIYALPGRIDDTRSQGCNELIRQKIAEPITSISSLTDSLGLQSAILSDRSDCSCMLERLYAGRTTAEDIRSIKAIISAIQNNRGITIEEIAGLTGIHYSKTAELVSLLEIDEVITTDLLQRCSINAKFM